MEAIAEHDRRLTSYTMRALQAIEGVQDYGPKERGAVVAFNLDGIHPHDLASQLDEQGIAVRAGHHCAQPMPIQPNQRLTVCFPGADQSPR